MKIYYVRHGQTDWNLARKMQGGATERNLNKTGIEQANETKKELENIEYDIIICSPMIRAKQTVDIIKGDNNIKVLTDERIRERKLGNLEGHEITEEIEKKIWDYDLNYQIPNGESLHDFEKRVLEFLNDIKKKYSNKTILIVAHGGVAKIIKAYFNGIPESRNLSDISMNNCEIIKIDI